MRLKNKIAIITGAGSGIGREAAFLFSKEGASVVVAEKDSLKGKETVERIKGNGGEGFFFKTDVSNSIDVKRMIKTTIDKYHKIDVLYNNAAIFSPSTEAKIKGTDGRVTDIPEDIFDYYYYVNLKGAFLCCKYTIPEMINSGGGSIINVASTAVIIGYPGIDAYTASKGGVLSLTRSMAVEYAQFNVRINCIIPGIIETPMTLTQIDNQEIKKRFINMIPLKRFGKPGDIAYLALYLASDESTYAIGSTFVLDGGITIA